MPCENGPKVINDDCWIIEVTKTNLFEKYFQFLVLVHRACFNILHAICDSVSIPWNFDCETGMSNDMTSCVKFDRPGFKTAAATVRTMCTSSDFCTSCPGALGRTRLSLSAIMLRLLLDWHNYFVLEIEQLTEFGAVPQQGLVVDVPPPSCRTACDVPGHHSEASKQYCATPA
jgi:hypothetical protein